MIVLMAGLPGSGKSTLAHALATALFGAVLDKDIIRKAMFSEPDIEYSTEQDDFCQEIMLVGAAYLLSKNPERYVLLDGRPFSRRYQVDQVIQAADTLGQSWKILECVCSDVSARQRIEGQRNSGEHPAHNRDYALYLRVKANYEEITSQKTTIDTEQPLEACVKLALDELNRR